MIKSQESLDFQLAFQLQEQNNCFGLTENAITLKNNKGDYKPKTLVDQTLELIDPTPNIHTLFVQFNEQFFSNILLPVEVKWSNRMTSCAGICSFHPRNRQCVITISAPLLKLRPRKDLVETLLHEMIHGYLFLTNNNRDRDGHGPEFCKHMNRINKAAGTKITIYHSFHDEVKLYQQHWWRCNGPCQKRAPYFGTLRRAMNRAPGPSDFWWKDHQQTCGGQYIKIKEPENFKAKATKSMEKSKSASKNKEKAKPTLKSNNTSNNMFKWLTNTTSPITETKFTFTPKNIKSPSNNQSSLNGFKKLGNNTNNVHGWGISGPSSSSNSQKSTITSVSSTPKFFAAGVLGGSKTGKSNLLNMFDTSNSDKSIASLGKKIDSWTNSQEAGSSITNNKKPLNESNFKLVECPICSNFISNNDINKHINFCTVTSEKIRKADGEFMSKVYNVSSANSQTKTDDSTSAQKRKTSTNILPSKQVKLDNTENLRKANCPVCNRNIELTEINNHLDKCLSIANEQNNSTIVLDNTNCKDQTIDESIISIGSTSSSNISSPPIIEDCKDIYSISGPQKNDVTVAGSHKCLICNTLISPEISLNDHLEDCIGSIFNDDSMSSECDNKETKEKASKVSCSRGDEYPCPVCMQLISEYLMNCHLDECLKITG